MTKLVIGKDRISVTEAERYVSGTQDAYKCTVTFSRDWESLDRTLVFRASRSDDPCDEVYAKVPAPSMSMKFTIPNKMFECPAQKIQVSATGSRKGKSSAVQLQTPWTSLGRVIEGATTPVTPCPDDPSYSNLIPPGGLKDQVLAKASDEDYDFYWMSISNLPVTYADAVLKPIGTIMYWAGSLDDIPEGWALCDGQNGTPDLRDKVIIGKGADTVETPDIPTEPEEGTEPGLSTQDLSENLATYALYPIMNLSAEPAGGDGKSAYDIAVENGFEGTEAEWLESLKGESAYELAVAGGYTGSEQDFNKALSNISFFPVLRNATITSAKDLPTQGDGCYVFENVTVNAHVFANELVYLSTTTPHHIRLTLLSGTVYDFTTSFSETEAIVNEDIYPQSIPIPTFTDVMFRNRSDVFSRNALGTIHLVNSGFDLTGYSKILQFANDIVYLARGANTFTLYVPNGDWYVFELGEEQTFVYKESGTLHSQKAAKVSFDDTTANIGADNVQGAIEALAARPSGGGGDTPSDFTPVKQFKPASAGTGPFILSSAKPFLDISSVTVRFTYASIQLPDGTNIHSFEDEFVYVRRLPTYTLEFYMSDGEVLQITYNSTTKDFVSFKIETSIYENVFTFVKNKLVTSTTELYAAFEQNTSKCYHLKNMSFQKIGDKAQFFKDDIVSVTWVNGSEVCYINGLDRTLRLTWDSSAGTAFTAVEVVEFIASDVAFDDSTAKLGATNVQTAVDTLATAMPVIKNMTFTKTSDLIPYEAMQTYRLINVSFKNSNGYIAIFANDPVYFAGVPNPINEGYAPTLYTMDGKKIEITANADGVFTDSVKTDAFDTAAPESLPFQIIENVTFTSFSQFGDLGITNDEMFLARNVSFKLPDAEKYAFRITGVDWVKVGWASSMTLKVYSTDADWHIEWDSSAVGKPFTKIENWNNREGLSTEVGVMTDNVNDLLALRSFFDCAMHLRASTIITSAEGGTSQRSYEDDVVYATHDTTSKTVTITRLNNQVDVFTYDDTGAFTSVTTTEVGDGSEATLPFPVIEGKTFSSMHELEAAGVTAYSMAYMKNCKFKLPDASTNFLFVITPDFLAFSWASSMTITTFSNSCKYHVQYDPDATGRPFLSARVSNSDRPLTTLFGKTYSNVSTLKADVPADQTVHLFDTKFAVANDATAYYLFDNEVAELSYDDAASTVRVNMIGGKYVTCSYGEDGGFTSVTSGQNGSGSSVTFGDGLTETDGVVSVTTPVRGVFTEEEFDALTANERKGLCFIDDGNNATIINRDVYSTEESVVGKWTDGRPVYRKVLNLTTPSTASSWQTLTTGISDLGTVVSAFGFTTASSGSPKFVPIPYASPSEANSSVMALNMNGTISMWVTGNKTGIPCCIVLEYTKTTDLPNSSTGSSTIYSMTERRIGTWIDGSKLYRRTFQGTTPNSEAVWTAVTDAIENFGTPIRLYGTTIAASVAPPIYMIPYSVESSTNSLNYRFENDGRISMYARGNKVNIPYTFTFEYTKTT